VFLNRGFRNTDGRAMNARTVHRHRSTRHASPAVLLVLALLLAACGEPPAAAESPPTSPPEATTSTLAADSSMGTTTTMSVAETSSSTVAPTSTLPDRTTTTGNPGEPQLVSGTKHREGTKISNELPEGAIGPSQHIIGEEEKLLQELTGASTYRLRSEVSGRFAMANSLVVDVAVIEGLHLSTGDSHAEWSVVDSTSGGLVPVTEEILVDGRRFRYAPADDEWEEF